MRSEGQGAMGPAAESKTVIITGGNNGIGFACAGAIADSEAGWHLVLACRNPEKATRAAQAIQAENRKTKIYPMSLDLASLASVRRFAKSFRAAGLPPLRALVCNAAMNVLRGLSYTEDGFETMFGVNHLGHFLLANLLAADIKAPARIIFVSSGTHDPQAARIGRFIAPQYQQAQALAWPERNGAKKMSEMSRYGTSKLCNVLCAYELDRRLRASGLSTEANPICVNAYTPGVVPTTGMGKGMPAIAHWLVSQRWFVRMLGADLQSEASAGADLARLILDSQLERRSSVYFEGAKERRSSAESYDHKKGKELWEGSAELVGLRPEESAILQAGGA